jgi:hypothetical protein
MGGVIGRGKKVRDRETQSPTCETRALPPNRSQDHASRVLLVDDATPGFRRCVDLGQLQPGADAGC